MRDGRFSAGRLGFWSPTQICAGDRIAGVVRRQRRVRPGVTVKAVCAIDGCGRDDDARQYKFSTPPRHI